MHDAKLTPHRRLLQANLLQRCADFSRAQIASRYETEQAGLRDQPGQYPEVGARPNATSAADPAFWEGLGFVVAAPDERFPVMRRELG